MAKRDIRRWMARQVRGLGSLVSAAFIVLGVLAFALWSMTTPGAQLESAGTEQTAQTAAEQVAGTMVRQVSARSAEAVRLYVQASTGHPIPFEAEIEIQGWKSREQRIVETRISAVRPLESPRAAVSAKGAPEPVAEMTEQLKGRRVLASVGPEAASVLPESGRALVNLVVTPMGETATLLIDAVIKPIPSPRPGGITVAAVPRPGVSTPLPASAAPAAATTSMRTAAASIPRIDSLSAYHGAPGTSITITGSGFGSARNSSWVTCAGIKATVVSWSSTRIVFKVPSAMRSAGYVGVVVGRTVSNGKFFVPYDPPKLTRIDPQQGAPGTVVTLTGSGFGSKQGTGWVTIAGSTAQVLSWSDTTIRAVVPRDATSGYAGVVANGLTSNGLLYGPLGAPVVESVSGSVLLAGGQTTIRGRGFGGQPGTVVIGTTKLKPTSWTPTEVTFTVPETPVSGYVGIQRADTWTSNGRYRAWAPRMTGLSSWWCEPGDEIELRGVGFGTQGGKQAFIGGKPVTVTSWGASAVRVRVPSTTTGGYVGVGTPSACSNGIYLVVETRGRITQVTPRVVRAGDTVTIVGSGFGALSPTSRVLIAGTAECAIVSWSDTTITAVVPSGARTGYVGVVKRGVTSNGVYVYVVP